MTDWLKDPLMLHEKGTIMYARPKNRKEEVYEKWRIFHFSTRLKLEGADYFGRLALGAAGMPSDLGLPLLAHRQTKWCLDAFFFELVSAYDTLLQEMNVLYQVNSEIEDVKWNRIKNKLPSALKTLMEKEWQTEWFKKLRWYRNTTTHHAYIPLTSVKGGSGADPWDYDYHEVSLQYFDADARELKVEDIKKACPSYLTKMADHIHTVWANMAAEFDSSSILAPNHPKQKQD